jgi:hypothetical protein
LKQALRGILPAGLAVNGLAMLVDPSFWYQPIPGVQNTWPLSHHFVRDAGCAVTCGLPTVNEPCLAIFLG